MEQHALPAPGPFVQINIDHGGVWLYRWWDSSEAFVIGEPATRTKRYNHLHGLLAALLADGARTSTIHGGGRSVWEDLPEPPE